MGLVGVADLLGSASCPESLSATANIFVGQTEAPLVVRPLSFSSHSVAVSKMTQSELFAVMGAA